MAGYYPDVPGNRFAYHLDGTKVYTIDNTNTLTDITAQAATFNDEDGDYYGTPSMISLMFLFPELRDVNGYFYLDNWSGGWNSLQVSTDTTTGLDGTWTTAINPWIKDTSISTPAPDYRTKINPLSASSVKALKFNFNAMTNSRLYVLHLYGSIPPTSNPDRLIFWEPVNNNATGGAYFDWGDLIQGSSQTKQFRIKNNSSTKTANSITLSAGVETYGMSAAFSLDNVTYSATLNIGTLAPGAISSVIYVKRTVPANEPLQLQAIHYKASAASWT